MRGERRSSQFLDAPEHISTNILASRLKPLTRLNLIERTDPNASARNNAFTPPQLSRVLHGWLLPAKPLPVWKTVGGAVLLLAVIGACLALFLVLLPG